MERRTQQERSAETCGRLLDATVAVLVERGWAGTSTPAVCERAGVSRGAQLHHFPTKAELVASAVEHLVQRRHAELRERLFRGVSLEETFQELWALYSGPTLAAWMELAVAARTDPELRARMAAVNQRFFGEAVRTFRALLRPAGRSEREVEAAARLLLSTLDGLSINHVLEPDPARVTAVLEVLLEMLGTWAKAVSQNDCSRITGESALP